MIPFHGTPMGAFDKNREAICGHNLVITWTTTTYTRRKSGKPTGKPTDSAAKLCKIAKSVLLDCGAFSFWRSQLRNEIPEDLDIPSVLEWYRAMASMSNNTHLIIPDVITGGEIENDRLINDFPCDLAHIAWPVWHTEENIARLKRLALEFGRVAIGPMGRHSHVKGKAFTDRMVEVFDVISECPPGIKIHALRGLQLAGGPFPFSQADSTDAGRNWSQSAARLSFRLSQWERRAKNTAKSWTKFNRLDTSCYNQVNQLSLFNL